MQEMSFVTTILFFLSFTSNQYKLVPSPVEGGQVGKGIEVGQQGFHQGNGKDVLEAAVWGKAGRCEKRPLYSEYWSPPVLLGGNERQVTEGAGQGVLVNA